MAAERCAINADPPVYDAEGADRAEPYIPDRVGQSSMRLTCPYCKVSQVTVVMEQAARTTLPCLVFLFISGIILVFLTIPLVFLSPIILVSFTAVIPFRCVWCKVKEHHCMNCNFVIGVEESIIC